MHDTVATAYVSLEGSAIEAPDGAAEQQDEDVAVRTHHGDGCVEIDEVQLHRGDGALVGTDHRRPLQ